MSTLGERIKSLRLAKGLSQQALAHACGWASQSRIGNYETGKREPNLADIEKIASVLGATVPDLVAGKTRNHLHELPEHIAGRVREEDRLVSIWGRSSDAGQPVTSLVGWAKQGAVPVVGTAKLGTRGFFEELGYPAGQGDGWLAIHSDDPNAYGLRVVGDSMFPRIKNGEFVLVEPNKSFYPGDEVMIRTKDGQAMIKEFIYLRDGTYRFESVNGDHPPLHLPEEQVEKIHLVAGILRSSRFMHLAD